MGVVTQIDTGSGSVDCRLGEAARTQLVLDHLWLADALAGRYRGRGVEAEDLQQVARSGLVEAAQRFDPTIGVFGPFATASITGVLKRYFRDHGWSVRPPRSLQQLSVQIGSDWSAAAQNVGHLPTRADLATRLGHPAAQIEFALCAGQSYRTASLDDESRPVPEAIVLDPGFVQCESRLLIERLLLQLSPAERRLLRWRYWDDRTQADIAQEIGVSQMQVSRLIVRALTHLRQVLDQTASATDDRGRGAVREAAAQSDRRPGPERMSAVGGPGRARVSTAGATARR